MDKYEPGAERPRGTYRCEYCGQRAYPRCPEHPAADVYGPCTVYWDALIDTWAREAVTVRPTFTKPIATRTPAGHVVGELTIADQGVAWDCYVMWQGLPERKPYHLDPAAVARRADLLFGGKV